LPEVNPLRYLEAMADQVAATGLKVVNGDVVGDDTLFPWEPYAQNWSIDDTVWGYGAPVSALTINDNQIKVTVTPGAAAGSPATVVVDPAVPSYYTLDVSVTTGVVKSGSHVQMERVLGSKVLRVYGSIAVDAKPEEEEVAIHDPAEYAAVALKGMLEARGIVVTGKARAKHRISTDAKGFLSETREPVEDVMHAVQAGRVHGNVSGLEATCAGCDLPRSADSAEKVLATHQSPSLGEDVIVTNKVSQNLHAELLLHQLGAAGESERSTVQGGAGDSCVSGKCGDRQG
jgi:D-alanyl-D-alanine carboxypeptidase/D-alanyl-D-alanine-endopeptidase (penicillin-binding protein 4)